jgi:hypothetical protein
MSEARLHPRQPQKVTSVHWQTLIECICKEYIFAGLGFKNVSFCSAFTLDCEVLVGLDDTAVLVLVVQVIHRPYEVEGMRDV